MTELHPDLAEGDAFLHNDPYLGNTHSADHAILVPVFVDGEHVFTACAKAHQADCGNALPTTYMPGARDIYEEGAINFPCVRVQRDHRDLEDVVRMCRRRIRVPEQWYGDYLAALGAARIAERRLKELCGQYGLATIRSFVQEWFDYSERRMIEALRALPAGSLEGLGRHDPYPGLPDGIPLRVKVRIDPGEGRIEIDLRDNPDNYPGGLNESRACATNNVVIGVFNSIDPDIPHNAGSFRRIDVVLREGASPGFRRSRTRARWRRRTSPTGSSASRRPPSPTWARASGSPRARWGSRPRTRSSPAATRASTARRTSTRSSSPRRAGRAGPTRTAGRRTCCPWWRR
jgi:N-methylhydantoinase B